LLTISGFARPGMIGDELRALRRLQREQEAGIACVRFGAQGIVSKRLGSPYRAGRSAHWLKIKNPAAPAAKREAEEQWQ
jgi:ATP-dependent DNA ligase